MNFRANRLEMERGKGDRTSTNEIRIKTSFSDEGAKTKELIYFDTNEETSDLTYNQVETTDCYRPGRPYKLFSEPGGSEVMIQVDLPTISFSDKVDLILNHCRTTGDGLIDVSVNDRNFLKKYMGASRDNFGLQTFTIPNVFLKQGMNIIKIRLSSTSPGVYWLSDIQFDIEKTCNISK